MRPIESLCAIFVSIFDDTPPQIKRNLPHISMTKVELW